MPPQPPEPSMAGQNAVSKTVSSAVASGEPLTSAWSAGV
jgi:hypothetical protein